MSWGHSWGRTHAALSCVCVWYSIVSVPQTGRELDALHSARVHGQLLLRCFMLVLLLPFPAGMWVFTVPGHPRYSRCTIIRGHPYHIHIKCDLSAWYTGSAERTHNTTSSRRVPFFWCATAAMTVTTMTTTAAGRAAVMRAMHMTTCTSTTTTRCVDGFSVQVLGFQTCTCTAGHRHGELQQFTCALHPSPAS